jgi:hypothetical protein
MNICFSIFVTNFTLVNDDIQNTVLIAQFSALWDEFSRKLIDGFCENFVVTFSVAVDMSNGTSFRIFELRCMSLNISSENIKRRVEAYFSKVLQINRDLGLFSVHYLLL